MKNSKKIIIEGVVYQACCDETNVDLCDNYYIIRSDNAGVFAGEIEKVYSDTVEMKNTRRLWYWDGAASLSELAMQGVSRPDECKFPSEVKEITVFGVIEIIRCTQKAKDSIKNVQVWTEHA